MPFFGEKSKAFVKGWKWLRWFFLLGSLGMEVLGFIEILDGIWLQKAYRCEAMLGIRIYPTPKGHCNRLAQLSLAIILSLGIVGIIFLVFSWGYLRVFYWLKNMKENSKSACSRYFPACFKKFCRLVSLIAFPCYSVSSGHVFHELKVSAVASAFFGLSSLAFCIAMINVDDFGIADACCAVVLSTQISMHTRYNALIIPAMCVIPSIRVIIVPLVRFITNWAHNQLGADKPAEALPMYFKQLECIFGRYLEEGDRDGGDVIVV